MERAHLLPLQTIFAALFVFLFFSGKSVAVAPNWPESVSYPDDISVEIISEDSTAEGSVYRSNHFELISDYPLTIEVLCDILRVLEANYAGLQALPLGFDSIPKKERSVIKLVDSETRYIEHGGLMGSGGIYLPESREALLHLDKLGTKLTDDGRIQSIQNYDLIAHEVTHQLQHKWLGILPTWLIEGLAVYLESVPFHDGTLMFKEMDFRSEKNIRRCTENHYWITDVKHLMLIKRSEWNQHFEKHPESNNRYYVSAFLLTYYFLHLNEKDTESAALEDYIERMKEADNPRARANALSALMHGRSYQELENAMIEAYAQAGFKLQTFTHRKNRTSSLQ